MINISSSYSLISGLLFARRYAEAIAAAESLNPIDPERDALLRMCLARDAQFERAAEAGRRHLSKPGAVPEDYYRQAQILLRCGDTAEALEAALTALQSAPEQWRYQVPVIEAILADPILENVFHPIAENIATVQPYRPPSMRSGPIDLRVPGRLPHYASIEGAHPVFADVIGMLSGLSIHWPASYGTGLVAAMLLRLPRAKAMLDRLLALGDPAIDRASAARYVSTRFPDLLAPETAHMDFLQHGPVCAGERPYVFLLDNLPTVFQPFLPMEDMHLPEDQPGLYAILRQELEGPLCRGIISIFRGGADFLSAAFDSEKIKAKTIAINPPWSSDDAETMRPVVPVRGQTETITWFFPASAGTVVENFYMRGGVDVLNAFAVLAEEDPRLRLILRGPLPPNLSPRLTSFAREHPGVTWLPDRLSWDDYELLLRRADLLVLPSVLTYRNGLVQAIRWGLVPVLADCCNSGEMVEDGIEGVIVPGRRHGLFLRDDQPGFRSDWVGLLQATDRPSDPDFHARFVEALRRLARDRNEIHRMSAHNLSTQCRGETAHDDVKRLNDLVHREIGRVAR